MNQILIDSGFLYALYHVREPRHQISLDFVDKNEAIQPMIPEITLVEVCFLFKRLRGVDGVAGFLREFKTAGILPIPMVWEDYERASQILLKYRRAQFDFVDTVIMAMTERLNITQVCTYDRRDFSIFRPQHCDYLELLP